MDNDVASFPYMQIAGLPLTRGLFDVTTNKEHRVILLHHEKWLSIAYTLIEILNGFICVPLIILETLSITVFQHLAHRYLVFIFKKVVKSSLFHFYKSCCILP